jgi:methylphosphotriester-DNA--protein-cysteine methyltransferase
MLTIYSEIVYEKIVSMLEVTDEHKLKELRELLESLEENVGDQAYEAGYEAKSNES